MGSDRSISRRSFLSKGAATGGVILVGASAPALLTGCSSGTSTSANAGHAAPGAKPGVGTGTPRRGGVATIGTGAEIDGFFPATNHWDNNGYLYANTVYDPLTAVAADGTIQPYLAQSVTPNADYSMWTVTLRPGITFNDGSALTASVVKANYDALVASPLTGLALKFVSSVRVVDPMTVAFTFSEPVVSFAAALSTQVGYVVGTAMLDAAAKGGSSPPTPVGTGPFVYSQWQPNDHFTATRNPHYWRTGYPYLDQITYRPIPDTTQREATLRTGGVDLILSYDPDTINRFRSQSGYQVVDSLGITVGEPDMNFIMLNCEKAPTDNLGIRQALAKGMDQTALNTLFGGGLTAIVEGVFPKGSSYYSGTAYPGYDPAGARSLVAAYKKAHGTPSLQLATVPDPRLTKVIEVIQQMWQKVGFDVTIKTIDQATFISNAIVGNYQAYTFQQFSAPDPDINYVWWSTTTVHPPGQIALNFARNSDPEIEAALLTGRHTPNSPARTAAYQTVNKRLGLDLPYLWLGQTPWSEVGDARIQNFANPVLPNGKPGKAFDNGVFFPTQIWMGG